MAFSAILLVFENSHVSVLQVCKFIDLYGLAVKISDLLHMFFVILYYFITKHCLVIFMETCLKIFNVWWSMCAIICLSHLNHTE